VEGSERRNRQAVMNPSTALHWKAGPVGANGPISSDPWIASQAEVPKRCPLTDQGRALKHLRRWGFVDHGQVRVLVQWNPERLVDEVQQPRLQAGDRRACTLSWMDTNTARSAEYFAAYLAKTTW
jgi:hypothetical protein